MANRAINNKPCRKAPAKKNGQKFESIEARYRRTEALRASMKSLNGRGGIFGVFMPSPVNHGAAMSFQKRHG